MSVYEEILNGWSTFHIDSGVAMTIITQEFAKLVIAVNFSRRCFSRHQYEEVAKLWKTDIIRVSRRSGQEVHEFFKGRRAEGDTYQSDMSE